MNIRIKDYPLIKAIETGKPLETLKADIKDPAFTKVASLICDRWADISEALFGNVFFLSATYQKALGASWKAFQKLITEDPEIGVSLLNNYDRLYIYDVDGRLSFIVNCTIDGMAVITEFTAEGIPMFMAVSLLQDGQSIHQWSAAPDYSCEGFLMMLLCMEEYAPVEERVVKPGQRIRPDFKHLDTIENKSDKGLVVHIRDSRWFTTIVRNEDFNVRGFFRLQPKKKDGEWTRELIYIKPFVKHGYHRTADVSKINEETTN